MIEQGPFMVRFQAALTENDIELQDLLDIWESMRGARRMPARSDFKPELLQRHLGWVHLLDVTYEPLSFRFRLYGSNISAATGRDATGQELNEAFSGKFLNELQQVLERTVSETQPLRVESSFAGVNKEFIPITSLFLPLSDEGEQVDMVMIRHVIGTRST